jgi:hypothetical protein
MQDKDRRNSLRELNLVDKNIVLYIYIYMWGMRSPNFGHFIYSS